MNKVVIEILQGSVITQTAFCELQISTFLFIFVVGVRTLIGVFWQNNFILRPFWRL